MKTFKVIAVTLLLAVSCTGFAQKVKFKKGDVLVDDVAWLKYDGCGTFDDKCSLMNLTGDELIFVKTIAVDGAEARTKSNPQGRLVYKQLSFLGLNMKIELQETDKNMIEILYKAKILADGKLSPERVNILVEKYGTPFSDRLNR